MNKIPVGKTISHAYSFTFSEIGSIIGLAWICLVAVAILQFLPFVGGAAGVSANPIQEGQRAIQNLGITILELLLFSIIYVAITRLALKQRPGGALWHFALGAPEFRTFGAVLLLGLVFVGLFIGIVIITAILGVLLSGIHNKAVMDLAGLVMALVILCVVIFVAVRLWFVLIPATVVEERVNLVRAWLLTDGNFWRMLGILLAVLLPVVIAEMIVALFFIGPDLMALFGAKSMDAQAMQQAMEHIEAAHAPALIGIRLVFAPFQLGLTLSASAFAYQALAGQGTTPAEHF